MLRFALTTITLLPIVEDDVRARDRARDEAGCGSGRDKVSADRTDDLVRCETVRLR
jgi:hypothetical protein